MESCLYVGRVRHRRRAPVAHAFSFPLFMVYLDLAELDRVFRGRWLWSTKRFAFARFRRSDHLGDPELPLDRCVRDLVEERTGSRPAGPIRLLTHLRYAGFVMNPVSFHYCFDPEGGSVEAVVADVTNTPWGERHAYVLDARGQSRLRHAKDFHVSPFLGMDLSYEWSVPVPGKRLALQIRARDAGGEVPFDASLSLERREITGRSLAEALLLHPFLTARVLAGIYWQALRLWIKRTPFHPHPRTREVQLETT